MINTLLIQGYRSIQSLRLPMERINVITGANGSGKSNLYKAVYLLSRAAHGELAKTLAFEGGIPSILWAGKKKSSRSKAPVRLILSIYTDSFNYEIVCGLPQPSLSVFGLDPEIKEEYVWVGDNKRPSNTILERLAARAWITTQQGKRNSYPVSLSQSESVLSQLQDPHLYPELFTLCDEIKKWRFYHHFRTDPESPMRIPQIGVRTSVLGNEGHDLAAALQTIIEIGNNDLLHEAINKAFPGSSLIIHIDDKTRFEVQLKMPGVLRPLAARELSDGTLRYLCLIAALLSPRPAKLLALNEPEMSLHPDLMKPLAELINLASDHSQIWITTHSPELAKMIKNASGKKTINLVQTNLGTQLEGIAAWEQMV